jgi:hypothetical protein
MVIDNWDRKCSQKIPCITVLGNQFTNFDGFPLGRRFLSVNGRLRLVMFDLGTKMVLYNLLTDERDVCRTTYPPGQRTYQETRQMKRIADEILTLDHRNQTSVHTRPGQPPEPYQTIDTANGRHFVLDASNLPKRALPDTLGSATREGCEERLAKRNSPDTRRLLTTDSRDQWLGEGD